VGKKGFSNHRWTWAFNTASTADQRFAQIAASYADVTIALADESFNAVDRPPNIKPRRRGQWNERMLIETVLSLVHRVCRLKYLWHRTWPYLVMHLAYMAGLFNAPLLNRHLGSAPGPIRRGSLPGLSRARAADDVHPTLDAPAVADRPRLEHCHAETGARALPDGPGAVGAGYAEPRHQVIALDYQILDDQVSVGHGRQPAHERLARGIDTDCWIWCVLDDAFGQELVQVVQHTPVDALDEAAIRSPDVIHRRSTPGGTAGSSNQRIADKLVVSLDTVKKHVSRVLDKVGASNRTEAVVQAQRLGLIK
jgi:hypothetical protein